MSVRLNSLLALLIPLTLLVSACNEPAPDAPSTYSVEGTVSDIDDGTLYLMKAGEYLGYTFENIDSCQVMNGKFAFNGQVELPEMYYLSLKENQPTPLFIENSQIKIEGDAENLSISGSTLHEELVQLESVIDSLLDDSAKWESVHAYMKGNKSSALNPYLILTYVFNSASYEELNTFYALMDPSLQQHRYAQRIQTQLAILEAVKLGAITPAFAEKDTLGNSVDIATYRGSYILLDFWASWCGPCRAENPAMVEFYTELKADSADFEIIGIAADFVEARWKRAIVKDALPWINVSDVKGFDGTTIQLYGVKSLPYTVLLDKEGRIVEKGLNGDALRTRIRELLQTD